MLRGQIRVWPRVRGKPLTEPEPETCESSDLRMRQVSSDTPLSKQFNGWRLGTFAGSMKRRYHVWAAKTEKVPVEITKERLADDLAV